MIQEGRFGEKITEDKNQRMLASMLENNQFALELILNLIDLLRYEIKEEQFQPEPLEINFLLSEVQQELVPLAIRKNQSLNVHLYSEGKQMLVADYTGLKRILHNLINNAIQHLNPGNHIDVQVQSENNDFVFMVHDDGPGISPERQQNLFQRFTKGKEDSALPGSSGLGLYITKQIVNRHGGKIWVESVSGKGSTFYITIPKHVQG
jgi:signal transduction histidine kinase